MSHLNLKVQHNSLQFSDGPKQQRSDIEKIFRKSIDFPIKTFTESGPERGNDNRKFLQRFAEDFNHVIWFGGDCGVAVDRTIIKKGSLMKGKLLLAYTSQVVGRGQDRVMPWVSFEHVNEKVGRIYQGAVHYPTKGALPGSPNHAINRVCAQKIAHWMETVAKGRSLAFVNGDFNMNDRTLDIALGRNFTTMADELQRWPNTGHGPIDGLCSFDNDRRVSAEWYKVLDDNEFHLHADHYTLRGAWNIKY